MHRDRKGSLLLITKSLQFIIHLCTLNNLLQILVTYLRLLQCGLTLHITLTLLLLLTISLRPFSKFPLNFFLSLCMLLLRRLLLFWGHFSIFHNNLCILSILWVLRLLLNGFILLSDAWLLNRFFIIFEVPVWRFKAFICEILLLLV